MGNTQTGGTKYQIGGDNFGTDPESEAIQSAVTVLFVSNTQDNRLLFERAIEHASRTTNCANVVYTSLKTIYYELIDNASNFYVSDFEDNENLIAYILQILSVNCGQNLVQNAIKFVGNNEFQSAISRLL
jgi:hypothetical protein